MSEAMYEVRQEQYTTVIREMIRHENDLTNHRIMWLLIGQGFIANAYVAARSKEASAALLLLVAGVLVALSAFVMLYQSYQARGYLQFLGQQAKHGTLQEEYLPLMGWPRRRISGWWRDVWICRWIGHTGDVLEPWIFLPWLFVFVWTASLLHTRTGLDPASALIAAFLLSVVVLGVTCIVLVRSQRNDEERTADRVAASRADGGRKPAE